MCGNFPGGRLNESTPGLTGFLVGGFVGACLCIFGGLLIEEHFVQQFYDSSDTFVSYGQSTIIFLPICAMIGAMTGFIVGAAFSPTWGLGPVFLMLAILANATLLWISIGSLIEFFGGQTFEQQSMNRGNLVSSGELTITLAVTTTSAVLSLLFGLGRKIRRRETGSTRCS